MKFFGHEIVPDIAPEATPLWRQILRGFSQCAFQANEITGVFFILAVLAYSWQMAAFYAVSVVIATVVARMLGANPTFLGLGLYGFNSGLMGLALCNFFAATPTLWMWMPILAVIVAVISVFLGRVLPFPFIAAPFIAAFWVLWPFADMLGFTANSFPAFQDEKVYFLPAAIAALGSTLFAGSMVSGVLFLVGLAGSEWRHALVAVIGAILAASIAAYVGAMGGLINSGFIAFNAVLAAIGAVVLISADLRLAILAAFLATWIFSIFTRYWPEPALAVGFVLAIWGIMMLERVNRSLNSRSIAG